MRFIFKIIGTAFLMLSFNAYAQQIKGRVFDEYGGVLTEAFIKVSETKVVATTDSNGRFSIDATLGQHLEITHAGMQFQKIAIDKKFIELVLKEDIEELSEIVVTGFNTVKSKDFVGASSSVSMKDIHLGGMVDLSRMLEGRVAGLNIQNVNNAFGSAPRINIRGGASINANVQPLWVVDGAVYEDLVSLTLEQLVSGDAVTLIGSAIAGINVSDIKDVQVLKDASATSMYGARALNGVIVVTTKKGRRNSPNKIDYFFEQSFRSVPSYNNYNLLNSQQSMAIYQEMQRKGYFNEEDALYGRRAGVFYQMYKKINTFNPATSSFELVNTPQEKRNFLSRAEKLNTDWFSVLFRPVPTQNHSISYQGGGENSATYASIGFYHDPGWSIADQVNRFTANMSSSFYINDKFTTEFSIQGNIRNQKAPGTFARKANTTNGYFERDFDINPFSYALNTSRTLSPYEKQGELAYYRNNWAPFNILNEYANNYIDVQVSDFKIQNQTDFKINDDFKWKALLSYRKAISVNSHYVHENSNVIQAFRANENQRITSENIYLLKDNQHPLADPKSVLPNGGIFNKTENSLESFLSRLSVEYQKNYGNNHALKLFSFAELRSATRDSNPFQGYGIQFNRGNKVFTDPLVFEKLNQDDTEYFGLTTLKSRAVTFSTNLIYSFKDRYVLNIVGNLEGSNSSGVGSGSRWLPTWNIGTKWNLDQEQFLKKSKNISELAIRVNYGLVAKMNEQVINSTSIFGSGITNRIDSKDRENLIELIHLQNRDLTWEKMYELNLGIDLGFWNNKTNVVLDVYQRNSFDLIDLVRTSAIGGQYYKFANFGDMKTRGIELTIQNKILDIGAFKWKTSFVASYYHQQITRLNNKPTALDLVSGTGKANMLGYPRGALFSYKFKGLQENGLPTFDFGNYPFENEPYPEISGANFSDSKYVQSYLKYEGALEPNFTAGLSSTFTYKNFELSFFITAQGGNKIRLQPTFDPSFADLNVFSKDYYDRWLYSGDENKTNVPVIPSVDLIKKIGNNNIVQAYSTYNYSDVKVADGSFIRMKNISLGYTLSTSLAKHFGVKGAQFKLQATNPFLIFSDKKLRGQDPEFYQTGGVSVPVFRQYTLLFSVTF